jgi:hypothetical protein
MRCFILILSLTVLNCTAQSKDCTRFKTGTFKYADPELKDWIVTRTDTVQIEKNSKTGRTLIGKVEWVSDCEYDLTFIDVNSPNKEILGKKVNVNILNTNKNSYESYGVSGEETAKSTLIKIE